MRPRAIRRVKARVELCWRVENKHEMAKRPPHIKAPAHLSKNAPVPEPDPVDDPKMQDTDPLGLDPTRYGDWTLKGIAVDF